MTSRSRTAGGVGSNQYQTRGAATLTATRATVTAVHDAASEMTVAERQFRAAKGATRTRIKKAVALLQQDGISAKAFRYKGKECTDSVEVFTEEELANPNGYVLFRMNLAENQRMTKSDSLFTKSGEPIRSEFHVYWGGDLTRLCSILEKAGLAVIRPGNTARTIRIVRAPDVQQMLDLGVPFNEAKEAAVNDWKPEEISRWTDAGWTFREVTSGGWAQYGFSPEIAEQWRATGTTGHEAHRIIQSGFTLEDVQASDRESVLAMAAFSHPANLD